MLTGDPFDTGKPVIKSLQAGDADPGLRLRRRRREVALAI
jgi:hypothetical protein